MALKNVSKCVFGKRQPSPGKDIGESENIDAA